MKRSSKVLGLLKRTYPKARTALSFSSPLEILVATILSAQCTDKRVNQVTRTLFAKYRTVGDFASADKKTFEQEIRSTGFYKQKTKNIIAASGIIKKDYRGKVPGSMDELTSLPGVARKTANIVLTNGYGVVEGIAVDTHVKRLSQRLGFSRYNDPVKIEKDLMLLVPKKDWSRINDLLIEHGRSICSARKPKCRVCILRKLCPSFGKF